MDGNIVVENERLSYGNKEYIGANFKIIIPQKVIQQIEIKDEQSIES
jgi:rRNA-processing protein FCF1